MGCFVDFPTLHSSMSESFIISFTYSGKTHDIESRFVRLGYIHQFHLNIQDTPLIVEYDEERNYRIIDSEGNAGRIDTGLLQELIQAISTLH